VNFLAASPLTKGLFHKVIAMSGASFTPLQTSAQGAFGMSIPTLTLAESTGTQFLTKLGVKSIAEARKLSADAVQTATGGGLTFRPVADGHVVAKDMRTLYEQGRFNDTPVLLGHTSDETISFGGRGGAAVIKPADFEKQMKDQFGAQAAAVLAAYPHATDADAARATRHVRNDTSFSWNMWTWARDQSKHGKGKVYSYYYDNHAPQAEGSGHGSDVSFHFQTLGGRAPPDQGRHRTCRPDQFLRCEFREERRPQWQGPAAVDGIHAGEQPGDGVRCKAQCPRLSGVESGQGV
jgi:para-nitrobenzyl esterase